MSLQQNAAVTALITATVVFALSAVPQRGQSAGTSPLVPVPKVYQATGESWRLREPSSAVIVLGERPTEPETYAAERLQTTLLRKTGRVYHVHHARDVPKAATQLIVLGQIYTNGLLRRLCRRHDVDLSEDSPGHDGFIIEMIEENDRQVVLIGGSNPRGVIYGQATFCDLLSRSGAAWEFPRASVRDWPSIAWRAFSQNAPETYLDAGRLDRYVDARLNFIELRDGPLPRRGHFGVPPGFSLNEGLSTKLLDEAHRRGFFVYGVVSCGVRAEDHDGVLDQFRALHELGVDGLYISFDDPGGGGDPTALVPRIVRLAGELGYTSDQVAFLPAGANYTRPDTPWNRTMAALPGLEKVRWVFTTVPSQDAADAAERIGLRGPLGWWHNWPIAAQGGLTMPGPYWPLLKLDSGWGRPSYDALRDAHKYIDHAMVWVRRVDEYWARAFGLWAWDPGGHDWSATQRAVYSRVFGPSLVEPAKQFDARLQELVGLCKRYGPGDWNMWVIHLADPNDRAKAQGMVGQMAAALAVLERQAPVETSLTQERLLRQYLATMRKTLGLTREMLQLEFPDYTISRDDLQERMVALIREGNEADARQHLEQVSATVQPMLKEIARRLANSGQAEKYVSEWERMLEYDYWVRKAAQ